ncbi:1,2-phenylacetyl-CoA epoxidase subunit PaaD [Haloarchaeobius amylolyticus]|uniref:1,2-phenylacetyl-CoA epoxidase subunit PaaD n=1 Tax=Haloarchaeobius amylolyticus TaxID=1198296 RepID=UPI00226F3559|nr:1,2-phenylacetyl-CoA epoxidase subunit PaaD [Haloarchaeobius amylolyticus]
MSDVYDPDDVPDSVDPQDDDCVDPAGTSACAYTEYVEGEASDEVPATGEDSEGLERDVWDVLYEIEDPEMPISIVDLGLIYGVTADEGTGEVTVDMTLTYSGCPARTMLQDQMREAVAGVEGVSDVDLRLVWSPEWNLEMVTEQGKEDLREFGLSI